MGTLAQVLAVEKPVKSRTNDAFTKTHHQAQKTEPMTGISRHYTPKDDEGDRLPSESTLVQIKVPELIAAAEEALIELFDITATKDWANLQARADIVIDGNVLALNVPVTYLLFLEKQLTDLHTFFQKLPVLDPAFEWHFDSARGVFATDPVESTRTKKVPKNHVKAEATDKHPAQVEVFHEDVIVGTWTTTKLSGALQRSTVDRYVERVDALRLAVMQAREAANALEVTEQHVGKALFDFILAP